MKHWDNLSPLLISTELVEAQASALYRDNQIGSTYSKMLTAGSLLVRLTVHSQIKKPYCTNVTCHAKHWFLVVFLFPKVRLIPNV